MRLGALLDYPLPTCLIMNRIKMMARKPAAETAAFVKAPETAAATVRAANAIAMTKRTIAAIGVVSLLVTDKVFSPSCPYTLMILVTH